MTYKAISLGWGVQSFTLAAMSALGILPKVDVAIHADTEHEMAGTYEFARQWTGWLEGHGVKVATVRNTKSGGTNVVARDSTATVPAVMIPAFTISAEASGARCIGSARGHGRLTPCEGICKRTERSNQ
jgi:hypothetical protein